MRDIGSETEKKDTESMSGQTEPVTQASGKLTTPMDMVFTSGQMDQVIYNGEWSNGVMHGEGKYIQGAQWD